MWWITTSSVVILKDAEMQRVELWNKYRFNIGGLAKFKLFWSKTRFTNCRDTTQKFVLTMSSLIEIVEGLVKFIDPRAEERRAHCNFNFHSMKQYKWSNLNQVMTPFPLNISYSHEHLAPNQYSLLRQIRWNISTTYLDDVFQKLQYWIEVKSVLRHYPTSVRPFCTNFARLTLDLHPFSSHLAQLS